MVNTLISSLTQGVKQGCLSESASAASGGVAYPVLRKGLIATCLQTFEMGLTMAATEAKITPVPHSQLVDIYYFNNVAFQNTPFCIQFILYYKLKSNFINLHINLNLGDNIVTYGKRIP